MLLLILSCPPNFHVFEVYEPSAPRYFPGALRAIPYHKRCKSLFYTMRSKDYQGLIARKSSFPAELSSRYTAEKQSRRRLLLLVDSTKILTSMSLSSVHDMSSLCNEVGISITISLFLARNSKSCLPLYLVVLIWLLKLLYMTNPSFSCIFRDLFRVFTPYIYLLPSCLKTILK